MPPRLRADLEFQRLGVGEDGLWIYRLYDPVSEKYFKINQKVYEIIKYLLAGKRVPEMEHFQNDSVIPGSKEDISRVITFLKKNNLLLEVPAKEASKGFIAQLFKSYIYFKVPLWRPEGFLADTKFLARLILNKYTVSLFTLAAVLGFILLVKFHDHFQTGIISSLNPAAVKFFLPSIILIKVFHELSHAYTATVLGCKVRSMGLAFIFMTPRLYTDVSDMVILDRKSRLMIALAGIWAELIIAGVASFFFISAPLHSTVSRLSISIIMISLISSLLFNGNPFMKFDAYYVLKELLKKDNLYGNAILAVKGFWRRIILGLKSEVKIDVTLLVYGHLSLIYRIFLYTLIVTLVYHFFIPALGIALALIEIWIFFIKPVLSEIVYIYKKRQLVPFFNKLFALLILSGITCLFFIEINIPKTYPAQYVSDRKLIRAEMAGTVKEITDQYIILENKELSHKTELLKVELAYIKARKNQMLATGNYDLLSLFEAMEKRAGETLNQHQNKLKKLYIHLPQNVYYFSNKEDLQGQHILPGEELAYSSVRRQLYVYFDANIKEVIEQGKIYLKHSLEAIPCKIVEGTRKPVRYISPQLSSVHGGPVLTDKIYQPLQPLYKINYLPVKKMLNHDVTCTFLYYRKTSLLTELKQILVKFFYDEF